MAVYNLEVRLAWKMKESKKFFSGMGELWPRQSHLPHGKEKE